MNNKICGIYKITSPSGKIYIGQSRNIERRWYKYRREYPKKQHRLVNSFKKYGVENHIFEIIEECEFEQLNIKERYWQDFYEVIGKNGLNCILTPTDSLPFVLSDDYKKRISNTLKGRIPSKEARDKMSISKKGVLKSEETKKRMSERQRGELNHNYGKTLTEEHRHKISQGNLGKVMSEEAKNKIRLSKIGENNSTSKLVLDTMMGVFYYCIREAAEAYEIDYASLRKMLNPKSSAINHTSLIIV